MNSELRDLLQQYLEGTATRDDLNLLIASFDIWNDGQDDDPAIAPLRATVGRLEALLTEVYDGMREEAELRGAAIDELLASEAYDDRERTVSLPPNWYTISRTIALHGRHLRGEVTGVH